MAVVIVVEEGIVVIGTVQVVSPTATADTIEVPIRTARIKAVHTTTAQTISLTVTADAIEARIKTVDLIEGLTRMAHTTTAHTTRVEDPLMGVTGAVNDGVTRDTPNS